GQLTEFDGSAGGFARFKPQHGRTTSLRLTQDGRGAFAGAHTAWVWQVYIASKSVKSFADCFSRCRSAQVRQATRKRSRSPPAPPQRVSVARHVSGEHADLAVGDLPG